MDATPRFEKTLRVDLRERAYGVTVAAGALERLGELTRAACGLRAGGRAFLIYDDALPGELIEACAASLTRAGLTVSRAAAHASEAEKSLRTAERLLTEIANTRHERDEPVVALGGGIVGDVAGFVAATYRRGVPAIQCPTTLLAMVDASVGGKTGVNLPTTTGLKKNMAGAFWQPSLVLCDVDALATLSDRQLRAGLAECVKHAMIAGTVGVEQDLGDWMFARAAQLTNRPPTPPTDPAALAELVARNVAVKAAVVAADERETEEGGGRALLNLGHTFAHAIETIPTLSPDGDPASAPLLHGEAVSLGLVCAAALGASIGRVDAAFVDALRGRLTAFGLPIRVAGLPADKAVLEAIAHDKKHVGGQRRFVTPVGPGEAAIVTDPPEEALRAAIGAIRG